MVGREINISYCRVQSLMVRQTIFNQNKVTWTRVLIVSFVGFLVKFPNLYEAWFELNNCLLNFYFYVCHTCINMYEISQLIQFFMWLILLLSIWIVFFFFLYDHRFYSIIWVDLRFCLFIDWICLRVCLSWLNHNCMCDFKDNFEEPCSKWNHIFFVLCYSFWCCICHCKLFLHLFLF